MKTIHKKLYIWNPIDLHGCDVVLLRVRRAPKRDYHARCAAVFFWSFAVATVISVAALCL